MTARNSTPSSDAEFFAPAHQQEQNWPALSDHLAAQGYTFVADPPPRQFTGGFGNLNFLIEIDGKQSVLRRPPLGPLPPGANDMGREYKVLSGLWKAFPLAPKALHFSDDLEVLGAPFFIMEYRPGLVIRDVLPDRLVNEGHALSHMLIDVLSQFQQVDPAAVGLDDLGNPDGFLIRAVKGWGKRFGVAAKDVYSDRTAPTSATDVIAWLEAHSIPDGQTTLLHNDYKLNNIILDPADPTTPIAVLDWDMCTRGDPLFDFATLLSYWAEPSDPQEIRELGQMPTTKGTGWLTRQQVLDYYAKATGIDVSDIHFYRVLTAFKLGVIFLQIYARYCRGTTADPRIAALGPTCDSIFDFAHAVMTGETF
jgi:aminoglycoside phosphotransferase (APT) family kinase protein